MSAADGWGKIWAVLIGVNEYERADVPPLRGCVNDVLLVRQLLRDWFGVENSRIRLAVNARATKQGILARLAETLRAADPGDLVVFYFSGHGSQIRDRNGDELADGLDEILVPYDMDWDAGRYIVDDEFDEVVASAPSDVLLEAFFDCCFGGAAPDEFARAERMPAAGPPLRFAPPPVDIYARAAGEELELSPITGGLRLNEGNVAWAASAEGRPASEIEIDGAYFGLFTYWGCRGITEYAERGELEWSTREQLVTEVRAILTELAADQRPSVFGSRALLEEPPLTPMLMRRPRPGPPER